MANQIAEAILHKWPGAEISVDYPKDGDPIITWHDHSKIPEKSKGEIDTAVIEYAAYQASIKFKTDRLNSYPDIGDQLDMMYHDLVDGTRTWRDAVAKVKADNPKPD